MSRFDRLAVALVACLATLVVLGSGQALAQHVSCGDTITKDTKLDSDLLNCPGDGIVIGAENITLDLNGHAIEGRPGGGNGVDNSAGHDKVTIEGGTIRGSFRYGVYLGANAPARHNVVRRLTILTFDHGMLVIGSHNEVENNTLSGFFSGIDIRGDANTIKDNFAFGAHVAVGLTGDNNLAKANMLTADLTIENHGAGNRIIRNSIQGTNPLEDILIFRSTGTVIARNKITRGSPGIGVSDSEGTRIERNVLSRTEFGIELSGSDGTRIERNVISDIGSNNGISLFGSDDARIEDNTVLRSRADGLFISESSSRVLVARNTASDHGDDGIDIESPSATVTGNTANDNGDFGIYAVPGVIDGGGNRAFGNGNPLQCLNIVCE